MEKVINLENGYEGLEKFLKEIKNKKILLVCEDYVKNLEIGKRFYSLPHINVFSGFTPNPLYESVKKGIEAYKKNDCEMILAIGGGSSLDVAKCIKLFKDVAENKNFLEEKIVPNDTLLVAIPTTAGTGSEVTRFAVIYYNGEKQSIKDDSIIPNVVIYDYRVLRSLSYYQRCSTMLDAFCHSLESFWSINSNSESHKYSKKALEMILKYKGEYLNNTDIGNKNMMEAARFSGCAINITETTAGHAMCYKLSSLYKISHGHAASLCVRELFPYMLDNLDKCIDKRGKDFLKGIFNDIKDILKAKNNLEAVILLQEFIDSLGLEPIYGKEEDIEVLKKSVNPTRLKNNPISLDEETIEGLYKKIVKVKK